MRLNDCETLRQACKAICLHRLPVLLQWTLYSRNNQEPPCEGCMAGVRQNPYVTVRHTSLTGGLFLALRGTLADRGVAPGACCNCKSHLTRLAAIKNHRKTNIQNLYRQVAPSGIPVSQLDHEGLQRPGPGANPSRGTRLTERGTLGPPYSGQSRLGGRGATPPRNLISGKTFESSRSACLVPPDERRPLSRVARDLQGATCGWANGCASTRIDLARLPVEPVLCEESHGAA